MQQEVFVISCFNFYIDENSAMNTEANLTPPNAAAEEQPLFEEHDYFHYELASNGRRFGNFFIDNLVMRFGLSWASGYLVGKFLITFFQEFYVETVLARGFGFYCIIYVIAIFNYLIYYTFSEKVFNGYTLGKLITGTRAIREDGRELTWKDALVRTLSRMVPFEAFSIWFGDGLWHDTWTKTMVVRSR
jgi:uncharacterized RDD family membrane protein YckC